MQSDTEQQKLSASLSNSPGFLLNKAGRVIRDNVVNALKPVGLLPPELGILKVVQEEGSPVQSTIAERCSLDRTTVTELLDGLEQRGLVVRQPSRNDRRCKAIHLTPLGRQILVRGSRAATRAQQDFFSIVSEEEWKIVRQALMRFIQAKTEEV